MDRTVSQKLADAWSDRSKRIALLFVATMGCGIVFIVSLLYGASSGGRPPNLGMIISGCVAVALGICMLITILIDIIDSD